MKIHSEDMARIIDSVPFYSDVQLSQISLDQSNNNKVVYYVKLLKVTYKDRFIIRSELYKSSSRKHIWNLQKAKRVTPNQDYNEYMCSESPFAPFVTRIRPLVKIGSRDFNQINEIARTINVALSQTDKVLLSALLKIKLSVQISEETNLLTPSPYCRVLLDVLDEVNCTLDCNASVLSSTVETSIR